MPQPVIRPEDLSQVLREALVLQRDAHPDIAYEVILPEAAPVVACDRRLLGQALTNLLQNAADAIAMRPQADGRGAGWRVGRPSGHITVRIEPGEDMVAIAVEDDGIGLPQGDERERLAEPYVTHKAEGDRAWPCHREEDHGGPWRQAGAGGQAPATGACGQPRSGRLPCPGGRRRIGRWQATMTVRMGA